MWKSKFYDAFVLNHRVVLHAIDATPARWRGDAGSSPLDRARLAASLPRNDLVKNCRVHPTHWLISTQSSARRRVDQMRRHRDQRIPRLAVDAAVLELGVQVVVTFQWAAVEREALGARVLLEDHRLVVEAVARTK